MRSMIKVFATSACLAASLFQAPAFAQGLALPGSSTSALLSAIQQQQQNASTVNPTVTINSPLAGSGSSPTNQAAGSLPAPRPSPLELDYSARAGEPLRLFNRQFLGDTVSESASATATAGAIGNDYVVGIGDEFIVSTTGSQSRSVRVRVDREGHLVLPDLGPMAAAGLNFGEVRRNLEDLQARTFPGSQISISLSEVRQISVTVMGETRLGTVNRRLSGFATVLDALSAAGGISPSGSARQIKIIRQNVAQPITVDLYRVLAGSNTANLGLVDGDRIIVPPIGPTVAITGSVALSGIYELPPGASAVSASDALRLAGGAVRPEGNRYLRLTMDSRGRDHTLETDSVSRVALRPSDILIVARISNSQVGQVTLIGDVGVPGIRSLAVAPTVRDLIGDSSEIGSNPYLPFAALMTVDRQTLSTRFVPVDLGRALSGTGPNPRLSAGDTLIVLSEADIRYLDSADVQSVIQGSGPVSPAAQAAIRGAASDNGINSVQIAPTAGTLPGYGQSANSAIANLPQGLPLPPPNIAQAAGLDVNAATASSPPATSGYCRGLRVLSSIVNSGQPGRYANAIVPASVRSADNGTNSGRDGILPCPQIYDQYPSLLSFVLEYVIAVGGEIRRPGAYPVTGTATLDSVVNTAGDITRDADLSSIELTRYTIDQNTGAAPVTRSNLSIDRQQFAALALRPGDVIRFNPVYQDRDDGPVYVRGEVKRPGSYQILRGEKLSSLLARVGGFNASAYPYGAVLTRDRVRAEERIALDRSIRELQSGLANLTRTTTNNDSATAQANSIQSLITDLQKTPAIGRVVIEADPVQLAAHPDRDITMEAGDTLIIPKRPDWITVSGEVLNPSSQAFRSGLTAQEYIRMAGGTTYGADEDREFMVYPNGTAQPLKSSFWNFSAQPIPPGSTIIVPRDLSPTTLEKFTNITQVVSQIALSAAALVVIGK